MPVTITGSKYGNLFISSVASNTVTVTTAPFVNNDFISQSRIVGLWDSTGATFKGIAWVRRFVNTSQLQLERPFINPITGATVTQVVGDQVQVSKCWAEIVTTGIAIDTNRVTVTDNLIWGTAGQKNSVCFYDESKDVRFNQFTQVNAIAGGLIVQGHLDDFASDVVFNGCAWRVSNINSGWSIVHSSSNQTGTFLFYGGAMENTLQPAGYAYIGSQAGTGFDFNAFTMNGVECFGYDILSRNNGSNWTTGSQHVVKNCRLICGNNNNSILQRWANGVTEGNTFKFIRYSADPLSIFGSDAAGTFTVSSPADTRITISDNGNSNALWRSGSSAVQTANYTNIITPTTESLNPGGTVTQNFYYKDSLTNLQSGSTCVIELDTDRSIVDSTTASGAAWAGTVYYDRIINNVRQSGFKRTAWHWGVKKYGFNPVGGAIAESVVDLKAVGSAFDVTWGTPVIQVADGGVSLSEASANTLTEINNLDDLYDAIIAWSVSSAANAQVPSLTDYPCVANGQVINFGSYDLVFDTAAGSVIDITGNTITIKAAATVSAGSKFTSVQTVGTITSDAVLDIAYFASNQNGYILNVSNILSGSYLLLQDDAGNTIDYQAASGSYQAFITGSGNWIVAVKKAGYSHFVATFDPSAGGINNISVIQLQKLAPDGSPMYQGTTSVYCSISFTGITQANIDISNGTATLQGVMDESEVALVTESGLKWLASGKKDLSIFNSGGGDYLFMTDNWRLRRASVGDVNATVQAFVTSTQGIIVDGINGGVQFLTSDSAATIAKAVWGHVIEDGYTAEQNLKVINSVLYGKTIIDGSTVKFRDISDTKDRLTVQMDKSERNTIIIDEV